MVIADGVKKGQISAKFQGAISQVPPLTAEDLGVHGSGSHGACGLGGSCRQGPPCQPAPQAVKELTPPTVADTRGGGCSLSSWHIALGHQEREGLKTASVTSVNGSGLIAIGTKTGRKAFPTQTRLPGCSLAPWHLSRGPRALAGPLAPVPVSTRPSGPGLRGSDSTLTM